MRAGSTHLLCLPCALNVSILKKTFFVGIFQLLSTAMSRPISSSAIPTMADVNPLKKYVCPYDKYHVIAAKIYPTHVANCRKMYTGTQYVYCPFNHRHHFPAVEYDYHVSSCPDKSIIENELSVVPAPNVPQVNHHPEWDQPSPTEDWDLEADRPAFSIAASAMEEERDHYDEIENFQQELAQRQGQQQQERQAEAVVPRDMSGLSKSQKKNVKRGQKRRERHFVLNGGVDEGDDEEGYGEEAEEAHGMSAEQKEQVLGRLVREFAPPGRRSDVFVDWVSILNQYCQKNKVNQPKYSESPNPLGGFGSCAVVTTERFYSDSMCSTKKEAKHSAARAALLGLNIAVASPDLRNQAGANYQRLRELQANKEILEQTIQSNQRRFIPGLSADQQAQQNGPSQHRPQPAQPAAQQPSISNGASEQLRRQMEGVNLNQEAAGDDEWQVVGQRSRGSGRGPGAPANNALRLAGRGRGRAKSSR